jgi:hypothetical protein
VVDTLIILAQLQPTASTLSTLYTVPGSTQTTVSSLTVCNVSGAADYFRVSIAPGGAADALSQYVYYGLYLDPNDTFIATVGFTLSTTSSNPDVVRCWSQNGNVVFGLYGVQIT